MARRMWVEGVEGVEGVRGGGERGRGGGERERQWLSETVSTPAPRTTGDKKRRAAPARTHAGPQSKKQQQLRTRDAEINRTC